MEQKVVIGKSDKEINEFLDKGWKVVSVTAQHVAIAPAASSVYAVTPLIGNFCFVLERN
jgi:hypothetical protein